MKLRLFNLSMTQEVITLFTDVFAKAEGSSEGKVIGHLVSNLISTTQLDELIGCVASDHDKIVGAIFFSRFVVANNQLAFILSPVAIATEEQGKGVGQKLIRYGLDHLSSKDVSLVLTYGDPAYYTKTGFEQIDEQMIQAPFPLSQPIGWLAQPLNGGSLTPITGPTQCVDALSDERYW